MQDRAFDLLEFGGEVKLQTKPAYDKAVSFDDPCENRIKIFASARRFIAGVQKIGHLVVAGEAPAGRGGNHIGALWVGLYQCF